MKVTHDLRNEHEGVLLAPKILEKICMKVDSKENFPIEHVEQILEFLRIFVDKCHHGKEEDLLFPALEAVGIGKENGPIGVMLAEHQRGRNFVKEMAIGVDLSRSDIAQGTKKIVENARGYIDLLRQHIDKENAVLFNMADSMIPEAKQAELIERFEEIEEKRVGHGKHEEFHRMLHSLRDRYL